MAEEVLIIPVRITNKGGVADLHRLRLIDAGDMYAGLHRAISYIGLSYLRGQLVERAELSAELKIYQRRTDDKCLLHDLVIEVARNPGAFEAGVVGGVIANQLTRALDYCFRAISGVLKEDDASDRLPKELERIEPFFDELVQKTEPHVAEVHAPIHSIETIDLKIGEADELHLNSDTKEYVSSSTTSRRKKEYSGSVTRLNLLTGNGRFYCNELRRIVSFSQPAEFQGSAGSKRLSWSLRQRDRGLPSEIKISVREVTTSSGRVKRFRIQSVKRSRIKA